MMMEAAGAAAAPLGSCGDEKLNMSDASITNESFAISLGEPNNLNDELKLDNIGDSNFGLHMYP